jgi:hypothetical protein
MMQHETLLLKHIESMSDRHWRDLRVSWRMSLRCFGETGWTFHSFSNRGAKGNGAIALRELCEFADRNRIRFTLWCISPKIFPYYESFGFVVRDMGQDVVWFDREPVEQRIAA